MNCNEFIEKIFDHALLEQVATEPEVVAHLDECPTCRERLEFERSLTAGFNAIVAQEPPIELAGRVLNIPEYIAAEERSGAARQRQSVPETLTPLPMREDTVVPPSPRERPSRVIPWWQAFWFKAGVSFAAAGFLLAIGVSQLMTTGSSVENKKMEFANAGQVELAKSAPKPSAAPARDLAGTSDLPADAGASSEPPAQSREMMAAAPAAPEETKARFVTPPALPPAPPVFKELPDAAPVVSSPHPPIFKARPEIAAAAPSEPPATPKAQGDVAPAVSASIAKAVEKRSEQVPETTTLSGLSRRKREEKPPVIVGEPLVIEEPKKKARQDTQLAFAEQVPISQAAPGKSKGFTVRTVQLVENKTVRSEPVPEVGDILLRETSAEDKDRSSDELAPESEAGFAPPPPAKSAAETFREEFIEESTTGVSPRKRSRVEEVLSAHSARIQAGTLDIDQWVLAGWISVKERIEIAPPEGMNWVAVKSGTSWKAELRSKR